MFLQDSWTREKWPTFLILGFLVQKMPVIDLVHVAIVKTKYVTVEQKV